MKYFLFLFTILLVASCSERREPREERVVHLDSNTLTTAKQKKALVEKGFEVFDYLDPDSGETILMQKYFVAFMRNGENLVQEKSVSDSLLKLHQQHLKRMYNEGFTDITGPFEDDSDIRGITIYNVPNLKMADSLANMDPMVKAGSLKIEVHPWWAAKGYKLR